MPSEISIAKLNNVALITLNGNALTSTMTDELIGVFQELAVDTSIRVIIITGSGKFFCTGLDLSTGQSPTDLDAMILKGMRLFEIIKSSKKPVIAQINGPALGGGVGLVFTTDIRIMTRQSYFRLSEVKRGLIPAIISQYIVPEIGTFKANQYMLTGEKVSSEEALRGNFITCVVDDHRQLEEKVKIYVNELISSAPNAMASIKKLVSVVGSGASELEKTDHVKKVFVEMMRSEEAAYGIQAFSRKETPDWSKFNSKL
ncbi:4172_t:CDS:1 [Paraglomus brasilianum]|uniref:4172_t:CDS:1 n=1 Tax=Paraglomus brasilianum TaxID=144538 RepID=A0A9N9B4L2_9GLOM|nr:4172_t:CDS:1 [Paraglomus brasilianum]